MVGQYHKSFVNDFKWVEETSEFNEGFIKSYSDENGEAYFLGVDVQYPKNLRNHHNDLLFFTRKNEN